jgi:hypothetical protein
MHICIEVMAISIEPSRGELVMLAYLYRICSLYLIPLVRVGQMKSTAPK